MVGPTLTQRMAKRSHNPRKNRPVPAASTGGWHRRADSDPRLAPVSSAESSGSPPEIYWRQPKPDGPPEGDRQSVLCGLSGVGELRGVSDPSDRKHLAAKPIAATERLSSLLAGRALPPDIEMSWRRSMMNGLERSADLSALSVAEIDRQSRLAVAAKPVLDQLADEFHGTTYCLALADSRARIIERRFGEMQVGVMMDRLGMIPGAEFHEERSGTNSIATVVELRRPLVVTGDEHYIDALKDFACYGHPILNPVTRTLEGVLDLSCLVGHANPLVRPLLVRSVRSIEQRLLEDASQADQRMLEVYRAATQRRARPVVVLGDTVVLANPAAAEMLDAADQAAFRELANSAPFDDRQIHRLRLSSGISVRVEVQRIDTTGRVLFEFDRFDGEEAGSRRGSGHRMPETTDNLLSRARVQRLPVLVAGETGTGRTTLIRQLAAPAVPIIVDGSEVAMIGERVWIDRLKRLAAESVDLVAIENLHLLPASCVHALTSVLGVDRTWFALTVSPGAAPAGEHAALMAQCAVRIDLPPLRARLTELATLARDISQVLHPGNTVRFLPQTIEVLARHPWPGNLREFESVLRNVLRHRSAGDIAPADLPREYQHGIRARRLTTVQQLEHDAIIAALNASGGNKVQAAARLGMSRATLYRRIKTLGLPN